MDARSDCPLCGKPLVQDELYATFKHSTIPLATFSPKLRATWCQYNPDCNYAKVELIPGKSAKLI